MFFFLYLDLDRNELAKFSKNYLPLLFNLYTADPVLDEPPRDPLLNCIKAYLSITNQKVFYLCLLMCVF